MEEESRGGAGREGRSGEAGREGGVTRLYLELPTVTFIPWYRTGSRGWISEYYMGHLWGGD